jgi:AcrR family transcriptional regulator
VSAPVNVSPLVTSAGLSRGYGSRPLPASRQRARILAAVAEIVCEQGSHALTVARISRRAGVSARTFGRLFSSTGECLLAAFDDAVASAGARASAACDGRERWLERVRAGMEALLEFADERPELARLCVVHAPSGPSALLLRCREQAELLAGAIEQGAPATPAVHPWTAHAVVGGVLGTVHARLCRGGVRLRPMLGELMAIVALPYAGAAAERELTR